MAEVFISYVFEQPIDVVWRPLRDFGSMSWLPTAGDCRIENGLAADQIGAIRSFPLGADIVREKLLALSDLDHACSYLLLQGPLPVRNMIGAYRLWTITDTGGTFGIWRATFDVADAQKDGAADQLTKLYASGWTNLRKILGGQGKSR